MDILKGFRDCADDFRVLRILMEKKACDDVIDGQASRLFDILDNLAKEELIKRNTLLSHILSMTLLEIQPALHGNAHKCLDGRKLERLAEYYFKLADVIMIELPKAASNDLYIDYPILA